MEKPTLFDLFNSGQTQTFNVVFYDFQTKHTMNYSELNTHVNNVSENLKSDIPLHSIIGCLIRPGLTLPAVVIGISKICSPFVFLDVHSPTFSLKSLQKYVPVNVLLVEESLLKNFKEELCPCWTRVGDVMLSSLSPLLLLKSSGCAVGTCPSTKIYPNYFKYAPNLAYIIQTSGTTGKPKIVQVPHQCIIPNIIDLRKRFEVTSEDVLLMCSPLTFDPSIVELFIAIVSGCTLVITPDQLKCVPRRICNVIVDSKITVIQATPSLIKSFTEKFIKEILFSEISPLRVMAFGGEVCPSVNLLKRWISPKNKTQLFNLYGLTEVSSWASCQKIGLEDFPDDIPLGDPLLETTIDVNDEGEISIGGENRWCVIDDETWPEEKGKTMRPTGDFVSKNKEGLYFIGRKDSVIKHNGHKLSLPRISNILENIPDIQNHYVDFNYKRLKLYLFVVQVFYKNKNISERKNEIVEILRRSIPNLPATEVEFVPYIPLTNHGKCDHQKFFTISKSKEHQNKVLNLINYSEIISNLWKSYTNQPSISKGDNFILNGGDSFSAVQFALNIEWELQINAPELVEKLLNDTFQDVVEAVRKYSAQTKRTNRNSDLSFSDSRPDSADSKRIHLDRFQCFEMATRRGYSLMCGHYGDETCCSRDLELQKDAQISLKFRCKFDLKKCVDASPCVAYFFESNKLLAFIGSHSGQFNCINVIENNLEWTTSLPDRIESSSCLSSCGKYVIVGCYDQHLYGIEITTGNIYWSLKTEGEVKSSPVVSPQNVAYVGSRDKHLYAVEADNGKLVWKQRISKGSIFSSPALSQDRASIAVATLDGVIAVLKVDTGAIIWTYNHGKPLFSSPLLSSTSIFIGSTYNCLLQLDLSGKLVSQHSTYGPVFSSPTLDASSLDNEQVIFGCHDCNVYCVSPDTKYVWKFCCDSPVYATPFIFQWLQKRYVAVACTAGDIYILNKIDGEVISTWKAPGEVFSSPVVLNNILVIGCRDNNVYTFNLWDM